MHLHEGQYLDPVMRDMEAFLTSSQQSVSGEVEVVLNPYHFSINGIKSPHDLMNAKFGSYAHTNTRKKNKQTKKTQKISTTKLLFRRPEIVVVICFRFHLKLI